MKLTITRQTVAQRQNVRPGDVVDVADAEARVLMSANKAQPAPDDAVVTVRPLPLAEPDEHAQRIAALVAVAAVSEPPKPPEPASAPIPAPKPKKKAAHHE